MQILSSKKVQPRAERTTETGGEIGAKRKTFKARGMKYIKFCFAWI